MTEALVSAVLKQLVSVDEQEMKLAESACKDVKALTSTLQMLQAVVRDAETRQIKEELVKLWLEKLKDVVYDADDVLDEWNTRILRSKMQEDEDANASLHEKVLSYLLSLCCSIGSIVVHNDIGSRIKDIRESLDKVANEKEGFELNQSQYQDEPHKRLSSSVVDVSEIYGRDQDKNIIMSKLLGENSHQTMNFHVISIVGTGGFGKTTLAKLVLSEAEVKNTFEKTMWVCISEPFNLIEVTKAIVEEAKGRVPSVHAWEALHKCLCNSLEGKRFLLVLDDVWTEDINDWTPLNLSFKGGAPGSRVLVTTRNERVAQMMGSAHTHNLDKLSNNDCWSMFESIAFSGRQEDLIKLKKIGKEIAKKCNGVPLVVKIIGSLMRYKKAKNEWNSILESEIWEIQKVAKDVLPSLLLSYNHLPSILKQCLLYCAIFKKDERIDKDELVRLWMAQGFLGSGGYTDLEKIGRDYFDDLAMRSFFQDFKKGAEGNITSSNMHDLVHDFVLFLSKTECFLLEVGKELDSHKVRHLATTTMESSSIYKAKNL